MPTERVGYDPDGTQVQKSGGKVSFLGSTPIVQKTVDTVVVSVNPTTSGSALVASVHSIAVYAASQVNKVVAALQSYGLIT